MSSPALSPGSGARALSEGRFLDAHEGFEALWRCATDPGERRFLQAAAQLAAAAHKLSTGRRIRGALPIANRALEKLTTLPPSMRTEPPLDAWTAYAIALVAAASAAGEGRPFELPPFPPTP